MRILRLSRADIGYGVKIVLPGVNLELLEGERCLLLGANGAGKTSLLRSLLGFDALIRGTRENTFESIGYVPQAGQVDRQYPVTIQAAVRMSFPGIGFFPGGRKNQEQNRIVARTLELVGLSHRADQLLRESSGGEIQRALIARAVVLRPRLLILDESTSSLDRTGKQEILSLFKSICEEFPMTLLMTSHESFSDHINFFTTRIEIEDGKIVKSKAGAK